MHSGAAPLSRGPMPLPRATSWPQLRPRPWPAHLQARQLQKPDYFSGPFPQQAWSQSMQTLECRGLWAAPLHEQHLGTVCNFHLVCMPRPPNCTAQDPHTAFIPPFSHQSPKPALSSAWGNLSPSHHHSPHQASQALPISCLQLSPVLTPAPTI